MRRLTNRKKRLLSLSLLLLATKADEAGNAGPFMGWLERVFAVVGLAGI
jgi:hypothetical protein